MVIAMSSRLKRSYLNSGRWWGRLVILVLILVNLRMQHLGFSRLERMHILSDECALAVQQSLISLVHYQL